MAYESDYDCPECGGPMKLRTGKYGAFFGCRAYPNCTGTRREDGTANGAKRTTASVQQAKAPTVRHSRIANGPTAPSTPAPELEVEDTSALVPKDEQPSAPSANAEGVDLPGPEPVDVTTIPPCTLPLDEHQRRVVAWREGAALVAAGAGSGKTTVIVERTAALLTDGVMPEHLVTLVYNTSAAKDFRAKLSLRLGETIASRVSAATFHGWAFAQLKRWNPGAPELRTERIIGTTDGPNGYWIAGAVTKRLGLSGEVDAYMRASELIREALIDLDAPDASTRVAKLRVASGSTEIAERLLLFAREYQAEKEQRTAIDFADMLYRIGLEIVRGTQRAEKLGTLYAHVQVDEAQDINVARMTIAQALARGARSFVTVGDMRQSVYSFTGARPDLFRSLLDAPTNATLLTLPVNRRSTAAVVNAGNAIAALRDWNLGGSCSPAPGREEGEPLRLWTVSDTAMSEGAMVAEEILARVHASNDPTPLVDEKGKSNYVILTRTNAQAASFEASLMSRGIPVRVLGTSGGVWTTTPGREIRAYLAAAEGQAVDDITRIANKPVRFIKGEDTKSAINWAKKGTIPLTEALRAIARQKSQWKPQRHGAWQFADDLEQIAHAPWAERCKAVGQFLIMDLEERQRQDEAGEAAGKIAHPDEDKKATYEALAQAAAELGSLDAIERQIKTVKKDENGPAVEISTMHKAKGAEWHTVFVVGVAEGLLPHEKSEDEEEERRLFYVAITRAKKVCVVSAGSDKVSPFFEELSAALAPKSLESPPDGGGEKMLPPGQYKATITNAEVKDDRLVVTMVEDTTKQTLTLTSRPIAPTTLMDALATLRKDIGVMRPFAAAQGEEEPRAALSGPGSRFVSITADDMEAILSPLGFIGASKDITMKAHQRVYELGFPGRGKGYYLVLRVYSTIPLGDDTARELGEDSIKVAALRVKDDGETVPLHKRLPYACRTRNWRTTLLDKIEEVLDIIGAREGLKKKEG